MINNNKRIKFMLDNYAENCNNISFSSELPSNKFTNTQNSHRSKTWKPSGCFIIDDTNNKIYFNDGSNKTITLTNDVYNSPTDLTLEIQTKLNAISSNFTVTYSTSNFKFTISRTSSFTLILSNQTNATWTTIGFTTLLDLTGNSHTANRQRNHYPFEFVVYDFGANLEIDFVSILFPKNEIASISSQSTVKIQANNLNEWTSPELDIELDKNDSGYFKFLNEVDSSYRFWRITIEDIYNTEGNEAINIGHIYIGAVTYLNTRNVNNSFSMRYIDTSVKTMSENGANYFDKGFKYSVFEGMGIDLLPKDDRLTLDKIFERVGTHTPFYVSLDSDLCISNSIDEFTKYMSFTDSPQYQHILRDMFNINFSLTEVI